MDTIPSADEVKATLRPLRELVARLPDNWHGDEARKDADALRDRIMRSIEGAPAPAEVGKG
jgi:uncharacterized protein YukE